MNFGQMIFVQALVVSGCTLALLGLYLLRIRGHILRAKAGAAGLFSGSLWVFFYALELGSPGFENKFFWNKMQYLGIATLPTVWFIYAVIFTGRERWINKRTLALLSVIPVATLILVFTNSHHHLIWKSFEPLHSGTFQSLVHPYGTWLKFYIAYSWALALVCSIFFVQMLLSQRRYYRAQIAVVGVASVLVLLAHLLHEKLGEKFFNIDPEPFAITAACALVAWGIFRLRLGDAVPVAHRVVVRGLADGVLAVDMENRILEINDAMAGFLGAEAESCMGLPLASVWPDAPATALDPEAPLPLVAEFETGDEDAPRYYDLRISLLKDGRGQTLGRVFLMRDITVAREARKALEQANEELDARVRERTSELSLANQAMQTEMEAHKKTARRLRDSEARYRKIFETAGDGIVIFDREGFIMDTNPAFCWLLGYTPDEVKGAAMSFLLGPDSGPWPGDSLPRYQGDGPVPFCIQAALRHKEGYSVHVEISLVPFSRESRPAFLGFVRDMTERLRAEEEMARARDQWENTFNAVQDRITIQDEDRRIVRLNASALKEYGQRALGRSCDEVFKRQDGTCATCDAMGRVPEAEVSFEEEDPESGKVFQITLSPILGKEGIREGYVRTARDMTDRKRLEEKLRRSHKMDALGTLAGGVAHDFNNFLAGIILNLEFAMKHAESNPEITEALDISLKIAYASRDLVKQILTFSQSGEEDIRAMDLTGVVHESVKMMRSTLPATIEIREDVRPGPVAVKAEASLIQQILVNLMSNAAQSFESGSGAIRVFLDFAEGPVEGGLRLTSLEAGPLARLSVEDDGAGMPPEVLERAFDPFFTTREPGKGTGLGLAVVLGILKKLGGDIAVESRPGAGSRFDLYIPLASVADLGAAGEEIAPVEASGRLLVVDDQELLLDSLNRTLSDMGFSVTTASSPDLALERFTMAPDDFDCVVTDMTMPSMTGLELTKSLLDIRPDIPVVLCTGYSELVDRNRARQSGVRAFLNKPVSGEELLQTIVSAIRETPGEGKQPNP